jgi:hypothetical protein
MNDMTRDGILVTDINWLCKVIEIVTNSSSKKTFPKDYSIEKRMGESVIVWKRENLKDLLKNYISTEKVRF